MGKEEKKGGCIPYLCDNPMQYINWKMPVVTMIEQS
jgi:hypothetical protein